MTKPRLKVAILSKSLIAFSTKSTFGKEDFFTTIFVGQRIECYHVPMLYIFLNKLFCLYGPSETLFCFSLSLAIISDFVHILQITNGRLTGCISWIVIFVDTLIFNYQFSPMEKQVMLGEMALVYLVL